jgi:hypothetical protein
MKTNETTTRKENNNTPQALGVGSVVKYAQILEKGDEVSRFIIVQELGDGKVDVAEITSRTAFGYSRYYRMLSEFVAVTDADELEAIAEQIKNDGDPLYLQYLDKLAEERKAREAAAADTLQQADEITEPADQKREAAPIMPVKVETAADAYALIKYFSAILGGAFHPEDRVKDYTYTDENGNTCPSFAPEVADRLQILLDQAAEICEAKGVDICAVRLSNVMAALKGFDLDAINAEFVELLNKHEGETEVKGASREEFAQMQGDECAELFATAFNAWDELCSRHEGLKDCGLGWFAGASFVGYPNPWDLYIGDGEEPYIF